MRTTLLLILCTITLSLSAMFGVEKGIAEGHVQQKVSITAQQAEYVFECGWSSIYVKNILSRPTIGNALFARRIVPTTSAETISAQALSHKEQPQHNFIISRANNLTYSVKYHTDYYQYTLCCIRI